MHAHKSICSLIFRCIQKSACTHARCALHAELMFDFRLLFVAVVWGINFSVVKFALADFHPLGFTVIRLAWPRCFSSAVMLVNGSRSPSNGGTVFAIVRLGFIGITLFNIFFMYGLKYTTVANSALLISLSPLFGALIQRCMGGERLTFRDGAGLALSTAGVILVIRSHHGGRAFSPGIAGDLLTLCAPHSVGGLYRLREALAGKILGRQNHRLQHGRRKRPASSLQRPRLGISPGPHIPASWSATAFSAFIAGGVAYVLWYQGVKQIGVTRTIVYHYVMPFAAVLFAALVPRERRSPSSRSSAALPFSPGVYLVQSQKRSNVNAFHCNGRGENTAG